MRTSVFFRNTAVSSLLLSILSFGISSGAVHEPVRAKNGMVVTASPLATKVGVEILKKGGNAVDAAVAVGFALAVTYPYAGNIGGGGFMVIHLKDGRNITIDYREKAPLSATKDMFLDKHGNFDPHLSQQGTTSAGVPGSVAGLIDALRHYGTMSLAQVIQPAIDLAEQGFEVDYKTAASFKEYFHDFEKYKSTMHVFSKEGKPYEEGDVLKQPDLAKTLKTIRDKGAEGFYKGWVADSLVKQIRSMGGYITNADLEKYTAMERKPITGNYRGYEIVSMPPPSSGGIALVELLNILENYHFKSGDWGSSEYIHELAEAMKHVYADRTSYLGDSDFYPVPEKGLLSKSYAKRLFEEIGSRATPAKEIHAGDVKKYAESNETTHYSIYDSHGNAVSTTTTINSGYGSKIVVSGAGFFLNNEMDDFSSKPGAPNQFGLLGSEANSIQPQKRMLSSMTPTIVLKDGKPFLIIGAPGGSTIITTVLQVILNTVDFGMNIELAVDMPRIHDQWLPDEIWYEKYAMPKDVMLNLEKMGYKLKAVDHLGLAEGILIDNKDHLIYGAFDPRGPGLAEGY